MGSPPGFRPSSFGASSFGASSFWASSFWASSFWASAFGASSFRPSSFGASSFWASSFGASAFGVPIIASAMLASMAIAGTLLPATVKSSFGSAIGCSSAASGRKCERALEVGAPGGTALHLLTDDGRGDRQCSLEVDPQGRPGWDRLGHAGPHLGVGTGEVDAKGGHLATVRPPAQWRAGPPARILGLRPDDGG